MLLSEAKGLGKCQKQNKEWNNKLHAQRLLKYKMSESTITLWESVRGWVNSTTVGASEKSVRHMYHKVLCTEHVNEKCLIKGLRSKGLKFNETN